MRSSAWAGTALAAGAVLVVMAEAVHWRASRDGVPAEPAVAATVSAGSPHPEPRPSEVIVVLGFPSLKTGRMHPLQKWRTEIAVRSMNPAAACTLVFTGSGRPGGESEAAVMARYARKRLGVSPDAIVLEERARTTWQNIRNTLPYLAGADIVKIASDPTHARKGRRYLFLQSPKVAARLRATDDYRLGERWWLKIPMLGYALSAGRRGHSAVRNSVQDVGPDAGSGISSDH